MQTHSNDISTERKTNLTVGAEAIVSEGNLAIFENSIFSYL